MGNFLTQGDKIASINSHPTPYRALDLMADAAVLCLAPPARGAATGQTIGEIADLLKNNDDDLVITLPDLILGIAVIWSHYAAFHNACDPGVASMRKARSKTLREICEHLSAMTGVGQPSEDWHTSIKRCHAVWSFVAEKYPGDDARANAIRDTWGREAGYLAD